MSKILITQEEVKTLFNGTASKDTLNRLETTIKEVLETIGRCNALKNVPGTPGETMRRKTDLYKNTVSILKTLQERN